MVELIDEHWGIQISSLRFIRNEDKQIAEVMDSHQHIYIVKGEQQLDEEVEAICQFANTMKQILPTTTYIQTKNTKYTVHANKLVYTLETKLFGDEIQYINDSIITEIATQLATAHQFAFKEQLRLHKATSWSMFGGNKTMAIGDYDENELSFQDFKQAFQAHPCLPTLKKLYDDHRAKLQSLWPKLPKAATQGDFCYYNMLFQHNKMKAIFDFNLAGDEVLINESVAVGIYLCWHVVYEGNLTSDERFELYRNSYEKIRPFTALEIEAFPHLFAIIRAFRYDRVDQGIENFGGHEDFIQQTKIILENCSYTKKEHA